MKTLKLVGFAILLGMVAGLATIYLVPSTYELILWIILIVTIGAFLGRRLSDRVFLRSFWLAAIVGVAITFTHLVLVRDYMASHQEEQEMVEQLQLAGSTRFTLLAIAPVYWVIFGMFTGLSAALWKRLRKD